MTEHDITTEAGRAAVRRLCEAATPGPWEVDGAPVDGAVDINGDNKRIAEVYGATGKDAAFIAASRTALPAALDALDRAEARIAQQDQLAGMQYEGADDIRAALAVAQGALAASTAREARLREALERIVSIPTASCPGGLRRIARAALAHTPAPSEPSPEAREHARVLLGQDWEGPVDPGWEWMIAKALDAFAAQTVRHMDVAIEALQAALAAERKRDDAYTELMKTIDTLRSGRKP